MIILFLLFPLCVIHHIRVYFESNDVVISQFKKNSLHSSNLMDPFDVFNTNNNNLVLREINDCNIHFDKNETFIINIGNNNE